MGGLVCNDRDALRLFWRCAQLEALAVVKSTQKGDLAGIEKSLTALKCLDRIWQLANFRL